MAAGAGRFVVELTTGLSEAEVCSAGIAIVALKLNMAALSRCFIPRQETDVVGAEVAIVAVSAAVAGGADAGGTLE